MTNTNNVVAVTAYPVEADLAYVVSNREELVEEYYGLAVLVHNQKVVGSFKSVSEACANGASHFGDGEFSVHNMLDYRGEEDRKWDETLDNMTEEEAARLVQIWIREDDGNHTPLDFTGR
jgi:hypothetical protein